MSIKKILTAAAAALTLGLAANAAEAAPHGYHGGGFGYHGPRHEREVLRVVDHRVVFNTLRMHRIRYVGNPYFSHGRYVVRSYDRFGRVVFVQVNPYTGKFIGFVRF